MKKFLLVFLVGISLNTLAQSPCPPPSMSACCNTAIGIGHSAKLIASGPDMASYLWQPSSSVTCLRPLCDSVRVTPIITTTYTVTATDSCGIPIEQVLTVTVGPAGVPSISEKDGINIYPNPSSTEFTLDLPAKSQINVCDITGRTLFSEMENAGTVTFGKELNPGIYFLFIDGKQGGKLVKQ